MLVTSNWFSIEFLSSSSINLALKFSQCEYTFSRIPRCFVFHFPTQFFSSHFQLCIFSNSFNIHVISTLLNYFFFRTSFKLGWVGWCPSTVQYSIFHVSTIFFLFLSSLSLFQFLKCYLPHCYLSFQYFGISSTFFNLLISLFHFSSLGSLLSLGLWTQFYYSFSKNFLLYHCVSSPCATLSWSYLEQFSFFYSSLIWRFTFLKSVPIF